MVFVNHLAGDIGILEPPHILAALCHTLLALVDGTDDGIGHCPVVVGVDIEAMRTASLFQT